jgi:hypothetical protein
MVKNMKIHVLCPPKLGAVHDLQYWDPRRVAYMYRALNKEMDLHKGPNSDHLTKPSNSFNGCHVPLVLAMLSLNLYCNPKELSM